MVDRIVVYDVETVPTRMGMLCPPMVSAAFAVCTPYEVQEVDILSAKLDHRQLERRLGDWLEDDDLAMWGYRFAYDLAVTCREFPDLTVLVFDKLAKGLARDVRLRIRLHDIRKGRLDFGFKGQSDASRLAGHKVSKYSLEGLCYQHVPGYVPHKNEWQLRHGELMYVPIVDWPIEAVEYDLDDILSTFKLLCQFPNEEAREADENRAAWFLHLSAVHGKRVDPRQVRKIEQDFEQQVRDNREKLFDLGLLRVKRDGSTSKIKKAIQSYVEEAFKRVHGREAPRTDPSKTYPNGQISTARGVLYQVGGYEGVRELIAYNEATKNLSTFVPPLKEAAEAGVPLTPFIEPLVNSGRPSCSRPNLYNIPKKGGIRSCFVPPKGWVLSAADYSGAELHAYGQQCIDWFGSSVIADVINAKEDIHTMMTAGLLGMDYQKARKLRAAYEKAKREDKKPSKKAALVANTRSPKAKAVVFGRMGGLGAATMVEFMWSWQLFISMQEAQEAIWTFDRTFSPDVPLYFKVCSSLREMGGDVVIDRSGFTRGKLRFTQIANTHFQTPVGHGAKDAGFLISYEQYCVPSSPLYGTRTSLFLYDETHVDVEDYQDWPQQASARQCELMKLAMDHYMPDVPSEVEADIMPRWRDK